MTTFDQPGNGDIRTRAFGRTTKDRAAVVEAVTGSMPTPGSGAWIDEEVIKTPEHGVGRYVVAQAIRDFGAIVAASVGGGSSTSFRFPLGHVLDSELVDAALTLSTGATPAQNTVGSLRFGIDVGRRVLAPVAAANADDTFEALSKAESPQIQNSRDAYTGRTIRLDVTRGAVDYLDPVYLRVDAFTPDPGSLYQIWNNILYCTVTLVLEEMWVRRELQVRANPYDFQSSYRPRR